MGALIFGEGAVSPYPFQRGFRAQDVGLGSLLGDFIGQKIVSRQETFFVQGFKPLVFDLGPFEGGLVAEKVGLGAFDLRVEYGSIDKGNQLTRLHRMIKVLVDFSDGAGHLGADFHQLAGAQSPRGRNKIQNVLSHDFGKIVLRASRGSFFCGHEMIVAPPAQSGQNKEENRQFCFHFFFTLIRECLFPIARGGNIRWFHPGRRYPYGWRTG